MTLRLTDPETRPARATGADRMIVMILGLVLLGIGCALVFPPAGLIVPGAVVTAASLGLSLRR